MTREEIISMAREAGLHMYINDVAEEPYALCLERFAALVAAEERIKTVVAAFEVAERRVAEEREACAVLAETPMYRHEIAEKIRARGEK